MKEVPRVKESASGGAVAVGALANKTVTLPLYLPDIASELEANIDFDEHDFYEHRLVERCQEFAAELFETSRENQWVSNGATEEHPGVSLVVCRQSGSQIGRSPQRPGMAAGD